MRFTLIAVLILSCLLAIAAATFLSRIPSTVTEDDDHGPVGTFSLIERSGDTVQRDDLLGKVWVASFVFTCCTTQCPQISGTMAQLHHELADHKDVTLVTFTVDPERDTPAVLKEYAAKHGADARRWLFLTGAREDLYHLIEKGFHLTVKQNEGAARTPGNEVLHDFRLVVVDRRGHIRGWFDGRRVDEQGQPVEDVPRIRRKIEQLLREGP